MVAAETRSFRQAADNLNVEQSTVSRRVRDLEDQLGARIFDRSPSGVTLTAAGERFLDGAHAAIERLRGAAVLAKDMGAAERSRVRIGVTTTAIGEEGLNLLRAVAATDRAEIVLEEGERKTQLARLEAGGLDLAIIVDAPRRKRLSSQRLWSEQLVAAFPTGHRVEALRTVTWTDLCVERLLFPDVGAAEVQAIVRRRLGADAALLGRRAGYGSLLALVAMGQGVVIAPAPVRASEAAGVIWRPIRRETLQYFAAWSPRASPPFVQALLKHASQGGFSD